MTYYGQIVQWHFRIVVELHIRFVSSPGSWQIRTFLASLTSTTNGV